MIQTALFGIENILIFGGIAMIIRSIVLYGQRTSDWKGAIAMFVKRIPLKVNEAKWYKLGVSMFLLGVVLRIVNFTLWPSA
ncbi:hypothetical protein [Aliivibrio kagoshimensis]|jgi:hypothetical protein|uniref:hypothetical protein n=1 Tax=Aliivibrio kagoshimensis TaxID=2910230 RepID=UPI003D0B74B5